MSITTLVHDRLHFQITVTHTHRHSLYVFIVAQHKEYDPFTSTHQHEDTMTSTVRNLILAGRNDNTGNKYAVENNNNAFLIVFLALIHDLKCNISVSVGNIACILS